MKNSMSQKLFNSDYEIYKKAENEFLFSNKQIMFEQYKLLIDSAHKVEERRSGSNSVFLGINTLLSSLLVRPSQLSVAQEKDLIMLFLLILIGVLISWNWVRVIDSYKKLNFINFLLIEDFEKFLPTKVFSLRAELEEIKSGKKKQQDFEKTKANVILTRESLLPEVFILFYIIYFIVMLCVMIFS